jgi:hypothetical protein
MFLTKAIGVSRGYHLWIAKGIEAHAKSIPSEPTKELKSN